MYRRHRSLQSTTPARFPLATLLLALGASLVGSACIDEDDGESSSPSRPSPAEPDPSPAEPTGSGECPGEYVATCLIGVSSCVDHYGGGYDVDALEMTCTKAGGELSTSELCKPSDWTGGCLLDYGDLNRCKITWQTIPLDTLRDACGENVVEP